MGRCHVGLTTTIAPAARCGQRALIVCRTSENMVGSLPHLLLRFRQQLDTLVLCISLRTRRGSRHIFISISSFKVPLMASKRQAAGGSHLGVDVLSTTGPQAEANHLLLAMYFVQISWGVHVTYKSEVSILPAAFEMPSGSIVILRRSKGPGMAQLGNPAIHS